jgi:hypothetical protein
MKEYHTRFTFFSTLIVLRTYQQVPVQFFPSCYQQVSNAFALHSIGNGGEDMGEDSSSTFPFSVSFRMIVGESRTFYSISPVDIGRCYFRAPANYTREESIVEAEGIANF